MASSNGSGQPKCGLWTQYLSRSGEIVSLKWGGQYTRDMEDLDLAPEEYQLIDSGLPAKVTETIFNAIHYEYSIFRRYCKACNFTGCLCSGRLVLSAHIYQVLQFGHGFNPRILFPSGLIQSSLCSTSICAYTQPCGQALIGCGKVGNEVLIASTAWHSVEFHSKGNISGYICNPVPLEGNESLCHIATP